MYELGIAILVAALGLGNEIGNKVQGVLEIAYLEYVGSAMRRGVHHGQ